MCSTKGVTMRTVLVKETSETMRGCQTQNINSEGSHSSVSWLVSWPQSGLSLAEDLWSGSCEGQSKLLDTSELSVAVLPMLSAKAVLGVKAPNSQSLTRLRTLQKLGLGDFDLARTLRLTLMPLFRCWAFLLAKAAVLGLLARR